ncbi:hypothetical protein B0H15DRAFT_990446 [Mycena belliarum]|uniref:Uncharacterized protein n=1 Tax=Mycena belliarum TaxID=1033014 RepID=A0AAD6XSB2_9AGAR|nr:hypothetical protein B0H15DRAFT_990446 [Mycena belliae]
MNLDPILVTQLNRCLEELAHVREEHAQSLAARDALDVAIQKKVETIEKYWEELALEKGPAVLAERIAYERKAERGYRNAPKAKRQGRKRFRVQEYLDSQKTASGSKFTQASQEPKKKKQSNDSLRFKASQAMKETKALRTASGQLRQEMAKAENHLGFLEMLENKMKRPGLAWKPGLGPGFGRLGLQNLEAQASGPKLIPPSDQHHTIPSNGISAAAVAPVNGTGIAPAAPPALVGTSSLTTGARPAVNLGNNRDIAGGGVAPTTAIAPAIQATALGTLVHVYILLDSCCISSTYLHNGDACGRRDHRTDGGWTCGGDDENTYSNILNPVSNSDYRYASSNYFRSGTEPYQQERRPQRPLIDSMGFLSLGHRAYICRDWYLYVASDSAIASMNLTLSEDRQITPLESL